MGDQNGWTDMFEYARDLEALACAQSGQKPQPPIELKVPGKSGAPTVSKKPAGRGRGTVD